jgi:malonate-semialdehyde dehydrogenase (acetylating) / methylmalonate-semialdehyde dehydrogenase
MRRISHVIGGKGVTGGYGPVGPVFDPATGVQTAQVELAGAEQVDLAVAAALDAWSGWRRSSLARRTEVMFAFRHLLHSRRAEVAAAVTAEHGKVASDALGEVSRGLENVDFACGIAHLLKGGHTEQAATGVGVHEVREPLGVVAAITPFNFPAMVPLWMVPAAIACGNAVVLKPSERDPSAALVLADLFAEAGLPDGVLNVVNGDHVAVDRLLDHPDVAAVSFVGSTPVARHVYQRASAAGKRVQALGGAKNHMVVLPDADLSMAADAAVSAAYGSSGQRCMAVSVLVPVGEVGEPLVAAVAQRLAALRVGPGTDPDAEMGPLVTREHRDRVAAHLEHARAEGATVVVDGRRAPLPEAGFFLGASLLDHVTPEMTAYREEIFGPVLCVVRADSFDHAVSLVNANPYGNGAAVFTRDGGAAQRFAEQVAAGMVGLNVPIPVPVGYYSFGGWKQSLFGDAHMYGPHGVNFYTRSKVITTRWPDPASSRVNLGFPA